MSNEQLAMGFMFCLSAKRIFLDIFRLPEKCLSKCYLKLTVVKPQA
ncbi:MAG: hypothetical protein J6W29_04570 [Neisseriaceae bacterium]|nr:hypothetical protein [Neisseriaceae bacterium]